MFEGPLYVLYLLNHIKGRSSRWKIFSFFPSAEVLLWAILVIFRLLKIKIAHLFYGNWRKTQKANWISVKTLLQHFKGKRKYHFIEFQIISLSLTVVKLLIHQN